MEAHRVTKYQQSKNKNLTHHLRSSKEFGIQKLYGIIALQLVTEELPEFFHGKKINARKLMILQFQILQIFFTHQMQLHMMCAMFLRKSTALIFPVELMEYISRHKVWERYY